MTKDKMHLWSRRVRLDCHSKLPQYSTVDLVCGIISSMRSCRVNLPNRCYHLISRVAHRAFFLDDEEPCSSLALADPCPCIPMVNPVTAEDGRLMT